MKKVHTSMILVLLFSLIGPFSVKAEAGETFVVSSDNPVVFTEGRCWFMVFTPSAADPAKYRWTLSYSVTDNSSTLSSRLISPPNDLTSRVYTCTGSWADVHLVDLAWQYYGAWLSEGKAAVFNHSNTTDEVVDQQVVLSGSDTVVIFQATKYTYTVLPNGTYRFVGHFVRQ